MSMFEFATATRIVFGSGTVSQAADALRALGATRVLFVTGRNPDRYRGVQTALSAAGLTYVVLRVEGEPTVDFVRAQTREAQLEACDAVLAVGGGSALDAGKAIASLIPNGGEPLDFLEVIGKGQPITRPSLPFVAVPTTAGTGSEVTRNAVLADPGAQVKASLRSPHMLPRMAIVDPELLVGLPPAIVAATGLDALAQNVEPFLSRRANPITDALAREGIVRSARSLRRMFDTGGDSSTREDLALTSLLGGLCLANAGLGAVHGFAAPIGGMFDAPHGAVCAALLPVSLEVNLRAMRTRTPHSPVLPRFDELARLLTGRPGATAEDGIRWIQELRDALGVPGLREYGVSDGDVPLLCERAREASSMKANPLDLTDEELTEIATRAL